MKIKKLIKEEFSNFKKTEIIAFTIIITIIIVVSVLLKDNKIALISAVCGITYTILAGKGRVSCYLAGITGTVCYSYLAYVNGFFGQLVLNSCYYLPMEIIGIFKWSKHLKKDSREIIKTKLTNKTRAIYLILATVITIIMTYILKITGDTKPVMDSFTTVFSVLGQLLTVKRCIEQWYVWFFVNLISLLMWIYAYINGSNCFATIIMWSVYLFLAVYFLYVWQKEISNGNATNQ